MSDALEPCPFCARELIPMSPGLIGQPRWTHSNPACPIDGHILGGFAFPEKWNRRAIAGAS